MSDPDDPEARASSGPPPPSDRTDHADGPHDPDELDDELDDELGDEDAFALRVALAHAGSPPPDLPGPGTADDEHATRRVLDALERTRSDLARHGEAVVRDAPAMPPAVLAGLDRALAAERATGAPTAPTAPAAPAAPADPDPAGPAPRPPGPHRRPRRSARPRDGRARGGVAALLVAAVLVVVVAAVLGASATRDGPPPRADGVPTRVVDPPAGAVPVLAGPDLADVTVALRTGLGRAEYGPLADPGRRAGCLAAQDDPPATAPVGAREVVLDGRPAVLLVFTTGVAARFRVLVVDAGCGPGRPLTLADRLVGR